MYADPLNHRAERGVSIVELMVGMVIALLVGLVASSSALLFTSSQRQGISTAGASVRTSSALASIKEDIAQAGLGFFGDTTYMCQSLNFSVGGADHSSAAFSPLRVTRAGDFDQIDIIYADQVAGGASVLAKTITGISSVELETYLPADAANPGQAVLLSPTVASGPGPCTVRSITGVAAFTADTPQTLTFGAAAAGNRHNQVIFAPAPAYAAKSRVTLLGNLEWRRYRVVGGDLVMERPLVPGDTPAVLVRNVVALRTQYGIVAAAGGSTTFTGWQNPDAPGWGPLLAVNVNRLRALRIGVLTRSEQPEKPDKDSGVCEASATAPQLLGTDVVVADTGAISWKCFRYPASTVIVPLRNWAMGMRPIPS